MIKIFQGHWAPRSSLDSIEIDQSNLHSMDVEGGPGKSLGVGVTALSLTACVLLIVLGVPSYYWEDEAYWARAHFGLFRGVALSSAPDGYLRFFD